MLSILRCEIIQHIYLSKGYNSKTFLTDVYYRNATKFYIKTLFRHEFSNLNKVINCKILFQFPPSFNIKDAFGIFWKIFQLDKFIF